LITALVVFVERGKEKFLLTMPSGKLAIKFMVVKVLICLLSLNMAGVIPPIFASSIILFPATIAGMFGSK
jgi:preprotein translocase subunit SecY